MANPTLQGQLIDKAHEIQENISLLTEQRAANRRSLRDLATQGMLSKDEYAAVEELYPTREAKSDEERLAEAEEKAAQLRERLAAEQSE